MDDKDAKLGRLGETGAFGRVRHGGELGRDIFDEFFQGVREGFARVVDFINDEDSFTEETAVGDFAAEL